MRKRRTTSRLRLAVMAVYSKEGPNLYPEKCIKATTVCLGSPVAFQRSSSLSKHLYYTIAPAPSSGLNTPKFELESMSNVHPTSVRRPSPILVQDVHVHISDVLHMVHPNNLVFGGWDISGLSMDKAMERARVLNKFAPLYPVLSLLSYMLKALLVKPGTEVVNSLNRQRNALETFLKACIGLEGNSDLLLEARIW
ncbi:hypothetical protein C8R43DRAFT_1193322 [Mycena crocata]|nr:hypothetical protein C8R43DRAFT_1193322 [Mycena crocata]